MGYFSLAAFLAFTTLNWGFFAFGSDALIILSPHRRSINEEFIPKFKDFYKQKYAKEIEVSWIDQGGTSDDLRFLGSKFSANPESSGIDIFWGGGAATFETISKSKWLTEYKLPGDLRKQLPVKLAGVPTTDKDSTWFGSAATSFGIFYNKKLLKMQRTNSPKTWADLADPAFSDQVSATDPRHSGGASTMNSIILQGYGWDKGWQILGGLAANIRKFTHSSSDPIKAVISGEASLAPTIDFYAAAKIGDLGSDNLGFILPSDYAILDPDPVGILKGAPNRQSAERFIQYILSAEAQKILILPKGQLGGPVKETIGRMAVNTEAYNQVQLKSISADPMKFKSTFNVDSNKASALSALLNDLVGAIHVDIQSELKAAVKAIRKRNGSNQEVTDLLKPPLTEAEALKLSEKWGDNVLRNQKINAWNNEYKSRYEKALIKK
jgi:ABC-type Fe3+ transport system substrate-binding protein